MSNNDVSLGKFPIQYKITLEGYHPQTIEGIFAIPPDRIPCFHAKKIAPALERHPRFPRSHVIEREVTLHGSSNPTLSNFDDYWTSKRAAPVELKARLKVNEQSMSATRLSLEQLNCEEEADSVIAMHYAREEDRRKKRQGEEPIGHGNNFITGCISAEMARAYPTGEPFEFNADQKLAEAMARITALMIPGVKKETKQRILEGLCRELEYPAEVNQRLNGARTKIDRLRRDEYTKEADKLRSAENLLKVLEDVDDSHTEAVDAARDSGSSEEDNQPGKSPEEEMEIEQLKTTPEQTPPGFYDTPYTSGSPEVPRNSQGEIPTQVTELPSRLSASQDENFLSDSPTGAEAQQTELPAGWRSPSVDLESDHDMEAVEGEDSQRDIGAQGIQAPLVAEEKDPKSEAMDIDDEGNTSEH